LKNEMKLILGIGIPIVVLLLPTELIPLPGLTLVEHRLIAIFLMATFFWILEPIPIFATSLLIIFAELVMVSNKGLKFLIAGSQGSEFGTLLNYKAIMGTFASPIIILFLGGFFLSMAATKYRLDLNMARILLKPFGRRPAFIMMGLMLITALFSMFMSNTATTAMMLTILTPVLASITPGDPVRKAFVLAIPFAANIGGLGTPIGTPPNAVALKYLVGSYSVSFAKWMVFAFPFVVVLLFIAWVILVRFFPARESEVHISIKGKFVRNWKAYTVYFTFGITILLWLTDFIHGMNSYVVAMIPVVVFSATKILTTQDLKNINWDVLWLVSGGIALGYALETSGLALRVIETIPFGNLSPLVVVLLATMTAWIMAALMSNTATANLLLPIIAALGTSLTSLAPFGGGMMLILTVTMTCSLAMPLPVSTPPNAMAHATGQIETRDMIRSGILIGGFGVALLFGLMAILRGVGFFP